MCARKYRLDQTLIIEAGLLASGETNGLLKLLADYEAAATSGDYNKASGAELRLREWVAKRRQRKWSCGEGCKPDCNEMDCQFRLGC